MKKYIVIAAMALCVATSFAQKDSKEVRKDEKKQHKMAKKSLEMENATRNGNGKRSLKKMHKMEDKENRLDKKADK